MVCQATGEKEEKKVKERVRVDWLMVGGLKVQG